MYIHSLICRTDFITLYSFLLWKSHSLLQSHRSSFHSLVTPCSKCNRPHILLSTLFKLALRRQERKQQQPGWRAQRRRRFFGSRWPRRRRRRTLSPSSGSECLSQRSSSRRQSPRPRRPPPGRCRGRRRRARCWPRSGSCR